MKKHLTLAMAALVALALSSCGKSENQAQDPEGQEEQEVVIDMDSPTETDETLDADMGEEILADGDNCGDEEDSFEDMFGDLSGHKLTLDDLIGIDINDAHSLAVLRNAIYARHGYRFKSQEMKDIFGDMSWYTPRYDDVSDMLTPIEQYNVKFLQDLERSAKPSK